jgi:hypothetical protein
MHLKIVTTAMTWNVEGGGVKKYAITMPIVKELYNI